MLKTLRRESLIALVIVVVTFVGVLPLSYYVGQKTIGPFGDDGSLSEYLGSIANALGSGDGGVWFFIATPLLAITVVRAGWKLAAAVD